MTKKEKIIKLRKNGYSYNEICKKVRISKRDVLKFSKHIKFSRKGYKRYIKYVKGIIKDVPKKSKKLTSKKVRIISNLLFDGSVYNYNYHYTIMYINSSKKLINQFINDIKEVYGLNPSSYETIKDKYYRVKYCSKIIYKDLMNYLISFSTSDKRCFISHNILKNKKFRLIILKGFWENEGSISKDGKLSADLSSLKVIKQLSNLHKEFKLIHNISKYQKDKSICYKIFLSKSKENYKRFLNLNLFSKAIVTKGSNIGRMKIDVLKEYFNNNF